MIGPEVEIVRNCVPKVTAEIYFSDIWIFLNANLSKAKSLKKHQNQNKTKNKQITQRLSTRGRSY